MPHADPLNGHPIRDMPLIASMIDGALDDTRAHLGALDQARTRAANRPLNIACNTATVQNYTAGPSAP
jgi:hypothetical protein